MPRPILASLLLGASALSALAQPDARPGDPVVRYDDHRVVRITPRDARDLLTLEAIGACHLGCEVRRDQPADFSVPPDRMDALAASGIPFTVTAPNLQALIDAESARLNAPRPRDAAWFDDYKNLAAVEAYMTDLAALRPDLVTLLDIGLTIEGRPIRAMRIANDAVDLGRCKPAILLNATQHAREWITVMNAMYIADQLIRLHGADAYVTDLLDNADFIIVPVANPDGYAYTWTTERFWRKNRRPNADGTFGVDNNRNWGYMWGTPGLGSAAGSSNPDSAVYWGTGPFSEPENQALRDLVLAHPEIKGHNDIHSYGQLILWSWGWSPLPTPHEDQLEATGDAMRTTIRAVHGRTYQPGPIFTTIYPVAGSSVDWFYQEQKVLSMSYELRGGGFNPPPTDILLCAQETFPATCIQAEAMIDRHQFLTDWNRDCIHDIIDLLDFIADLDAQDPRADLSPDGIVDILDFLTFIELFAEER